MPPKPSEVLQTKVNSLTHELELSTFLNKGILQSNNEYKLRIAELERENAVLRTAERTLTATEDALELSEKRVRELEREKSSWEGRFRREEEARRAVERERDGLKGWSDGIIGAWGVAAKAMQDALVHPVQEKEEEERRRASVRLVAFNIQLIVAQTRTEYEKRQLEGNIKATERSSRYFDGVCARHTCRGTFLCKETKEEGDDTSRGCRG